MKKKHICNICGNNYKRGCDLARHLTNTHKIQYLDYYLKYIPRKRCKICGKETPFVNVAIGWDEVCCRKCRVALANRRREKTSLEKYGYKNIQSVPSIKKKACKSYVKNCLKKYGVRNTSQIPEVKEQISKTVSSKECQERTLNTNLERWNATHHSKTKHYKDSCRKTSMKHFGVPHPTQTPEVREKMQKTCTINNGVPFALQNHDILEQAFKNRKKKYHGYLSNSEYQFSRMLKKEGIDFKSEYFIKGDKYSHHFDFAIFKNNRLKCLVEIDGEYFHGLLADCDGKYIRGDKDYSRYYLVPNKVKFLVIDSQRLDEGFKELLRILPMKYKDWKKEMLRSIPKNIEDAIPKFSKKRMKSDFKHLCRYKYRKEAFLGKSILLHFCKSHWNDFDWKSIRKSLYKSPVSSHHLLEGLDNFKNVSRLKEKFRKKYVNEDIVTFKHHSPEKMLAICSLGKTYISKEPIDKESTRIIKFLKLNAYSECA